MQDTLRKVPELSLLSFVNGTANDKAKFVDNLFVGLKDYGFIILTDHVVDDKICKAAYEKIHEFFQLDHATKMKYVCKEGGGQRGYTDFGVEHAKNNPYPDLKEFWHVGREVNEDHRFFKFYPRNVWPSEVKDFEKTFATLYAQLDETSALLLDALGIALDVPKTYFIEMIGLGNSILRPIHYPPL